mgnify:CR=1 FL=1
MSVMRNRNVIEKRNYKFDNIKVWCMLLFMCLEKRTKG